MVARRTIYNERFHNYSYLKWAHQWYRAVMAVEPYRTERGQPAAARTRSVARHTPIHFVIINAHHEILDFHSSTASQCSERCSRECRHLNVDTVRLTDCRLTDCRLTDVYRSPQPLPRLQILANCSLLEPRRIVHHEPQLYLTTYLQVLILLTVLSSPFLGSDSYCTVIT